jgi:hypothetical protein
VLGRVIGWCCVKVYLPKSVEALKAWHKGRHKAQPLCQKFAIS